MGYGTNDKVLWCDRKRYYGLPLSFEIYEASEDRLLLTNGLLNRNIRQIQLYRIRDISCSRSISQFFFGVGTVTLTTSDNEVVELENIKDPLLVKELIYHRVEDEKRSRKFHYGEIPPFGGLYS